MNCKDEFTRLEEIQKVKKGLEALNTGINTILERTLDSEKRSEVVESLRKELAAARLEIGELRVEQEELTTRMDNAKGFLQTLKERHDVDFELMPSSTETGG